MRCVYCTVLSQTGLTPIFPEDTPVDKDVKVALQNDTLLCFPTHVIQDEEHTDNVEGEQRMVVDGPEEDGWTTMVPRWRKKVNKRRSVELVWEDKTPKDVSKTLKYKWVARADLVQD
ncbi:hypothetical protein DVH24_042561 [Malus domestica]|uniref:Uncharacterized protein n=1 Tax=Malus domestica TaxID=3750 RepID=A0A498JD83_MALDO|nr:hypothetical protein DVH24_042561 [Malus domestica]